MKITILSQFPPEKKNSLKSFLPVDTALEILPFRGLKKVLPKLIDSDVVYMDVREIGEVGVRKYIPILSSIKEIVWGVLDPGGLVTDVARLFFLGAKDYIGPGVLKTGVSQERLCAVRAFAGLEAAPLPTAAAVKRFPGWDKIQEGSEISVRFCYAALGDPEGLREKIGEMRLRKLRESFSAFMGSWAVECGGIAWMRDPEGTLLLLPDHDEGTNPILAAFRLILDRALVGYEIFQMEVPLSFRLSFHAGKTIWRRPGSTGTIVSGDVNYIFHLGSKFCSDGRITISADMEYAIPPSIRDMFVTAGDFEGRRLLASRRFRD